MNFKYRVDNADIILSPQENEKVKADIKAGKTMSYLRDDKLAINVNFIRFIKETGEMTPFQEENQYKRIPATQMFELKGTAEKPVGHMEYYAKKGWEHKPDCAGCRLAEMKKSFTSQVEMKEITK